MAPRPARKTGRQMFGYTRDDFPVAVREYEREISLPMFPDLTDDDVRRVVDALASAIC